MADVVGATVQTVQEINNDGIEIVENPIVSSATDTKLSEKLKNLNFLKSWKSFPACGTQAFVRIKTRPKGKKRLTNFVKCLASFQRL